MDARKISCFATPSLAEFGAIRVKATTHLDAGRAENRLPHANQLWMLAGFALFERLSKNHPCREVFPQAMVAALGARGKHKTKKEGHAAQLAAAARANGLSSDALRSALATSGYGSPMIASMHTSRRGSRACPRANSRLVGKPQTMWSGFRDLVRQRPQSSWWTYGANEIRSASESASSDRLARYSSNSCCLG